jgi:sarcosine oxidase
VVVQDGGAILKADVALRIMCLRAGDRVFRRRPRLIVARMASWCAPQEVLAQRVALALGPWLSRALPEIASVLEVTRQAVGWFRPPRPQTVLPGRFPLFILERGPNDVVYGFPDFEQRGVKPAPHNHGPQVSGDDWDPSAPPNYCRSAKSSSNSSRALQVRSSIVTFACTRTLCRPTADRTSERSS